MEKKITTTDESAKQTPDGNKLLAESELDEFELSILNESKERGFSNIEITVELSEDCLLKAARTFMVFEVLEQHGEVIKSVPSVNELEEEDFDNTFSVLLVTKSPQEEIKKKLMKISEVKKSYNTIILCINIQKKKDK